jgi:hypothetical protein
MSEVVCWLLVLVCAVLAAACSRFAWLALQAEKRMLRVGRERIDLMFAIQDASIKASLEALRINGESLALLEQCRGELVRNSRELDS